MPKTKIISLNGDWKYIADKKISLTFEEAVRRYMAKKISGKMSIPSNWQEEGLDNFSGAVWYFKEIEAADDGLMSILEFSGVDYFCDVWINDSFIGHHEGYFQQFIFDISGGIKPGRNLLTVKVTSPVEEPGKVWPHNKKLIKGIFSHHDCRPGGWSKKYGQDKNTGGIWNDVTLYKADTVFIDHIKIIPHLKEDFSGAKLTIRINYYFSLTEPVTDTIRINVASPGGKNVTEIFPVEYVKDTGSADLVVEIHEPELWWTWDTGNPSLYTLTVEGQYFSLTEKFGFRDVQLADDVFYLNGKKLFLRGTNIIPEQMLSRLTTSRINQQIKMIRDANINTIRMHAHVNRKEYYDQCDSEGILVWQDFALQWTYEESDELKKNAVKQIKEMVNQNYNHPSIAFWCCHNEPGKQINTLDNELYKAVEYCDTSRIIRKASNYEEHPYDGWYWGNKEHFAACPMGPLVTEFGAQAIPEIKSLKKFMTRKELIAPDWKKWGYHNFQYEQTFHIAGISRGKNIRQFISSSQKYQAELIKQAIDFYRRERFIKVNALFQFMFIDCWPSITWSVVDYYGMRKEGYFALKQAFQPLYISVKLMKKIYFGGQKLAADLWVINDFHYKWKNCRIDFLLHNKVIGTVSLSVIKENSVSRLSLEKNNILLPQKIKSGEYNIVLLLKNNNEEVLSVNEITIEAEKKPKKLYE